MESERTEEAIYLEELRGTQETAEFYDLVNSPNFSKPKTINENVQGSSTTSIHSTLNPIKSLTLYGSIGESSQEDSKCAMIDTVISVTQAENEEVDVAYAPHRSNKRSAKRSGSKAMALGEMGTPSKPGKKVPQNQQSNTNLLRKRHPSYSSIY